MLSNLVFLSLYMLWSPRICVLLRRDLALLSLFLCAGTKERPSEESE